MRLEKIVIRQFAKDDFQAIAYYAQYRGGFSGRGSTAKEAIGDMIFGHGLKFGVKIETEDRRGRVLGSDKTMEKK